MVVDRRDLYVLSASGTRICIAGLAIARQRPACAKGVVFLLLEDEHGLVNLILIPDVYERHRLLARTEPLLECEGVLERRDRNVNVIVETLRPLASPARPVLMPAPQPTVAAPSEPPLAAVGHLRAVAPAPQHFGRGRR